MVCIFNNKVSLFLCYTLEPQNKLLEPLRPCSTINRAETRGPISTILAKTGFLCLSLTTLFFFVVYLGAMPRHVFTLTGFSTSRWSQDRLRFAGTSRSSQHHSYIATCHWTRHTYDYVRFI